MQRRAVSLRQLSFLFLHTETQGEWRRQNNAANTSSCISLSIQRSPNQFARVYATWPIKASQLTHENNYQASTDLSKLYIVVARNEFHTQSPRAMLFYPKYFGISNDNLMKATRKRQAIDVVRSSSSSSKLSVTWVTSSDIASMQKAKSTPCLKKRPTFGLL